MLVFRDGRQAVSGPRLVADLTVSLRQLSSTSNLAHSRVMDALLRAGELECALAEARNPAAGATAQVTDALAALLVEGRRARVNELAGKIRMLAVPGVLTVSRPEGFAYYALDPRDFAGLASSLAVRSRPVAVIGIRSIGTTLSAVVAAAAQHKGLASERITVRPTGHPWDRRLELAPDEREWVNRQDEHQAEFRIVDEGPGLSGSSFLAVAEALVDAGVPCERITLLGSTPPDVASLRAPHAAARWGRFRHCFTHSRRRSPGDAVVSICGGAWRAKFLNGAEWPAVWPQFERAKFLSADGKTLFKFEGLGRFGAQVRERSQRIAAAGFGPEVDEDDDSYARYQVLSGRVMTAAGVSLDMLERIAAYCAWRGRNFAAEPRSAEELEQMVRTNAREGLGEDVDLPELHIERPVVADGRMHPHEWRLTSDGRLLKLDGASHGDDHFFPGPTDIAWDLAGAIVEWQLQPAAAEHFLETYRTASGDDASARLPGFLLAYALLRMGYCTMAGEYLRGTDEEIRFRREAARYRAIASRQLARVAVTV